MEKSFNYRWLLFGGFVVLVSFILVNCILFLVNNTGIFHTDIPSDFNYSYKATDKLTAEQYNKLNATIKNIDDTTVIPITINTDGSVIVDDEILLHGELLPNPQEYNLEFQSTIFNVNSTRGVAVLLGGVSVGLLGGMLISLFMFDWAKRHDEERNNLYLKNYQQKLQSIYEKEKEPEQPIEPPKYKPQLKTNIELPNDVKGIIAIRTWNVNQDGFLYSAGMGNYDYKSNLEIADQIPTALNTNGFYTYKLGASLDDISISYIWGIVELSGKYIEHANGIIRAERMKILFLIFNKHYAIIGEKVSARYNVPYIISENADQEYHKWLFSKEGVELFNHNSKIHLDNSIDIIQEAEQILKEKI